jgi:SAM-dependent methyltransferase
MTKVEEPLLESAPLAAQLAPRLCRMDPETGETCAWYHGFWQYLRLMRLASTPELHADFYRASLNEAAQGVRAPRVLIAGAADYSMLAHVLSAFRGRGIRPRVTVTDVCETPLELNRWYARCLRSTIDTLRCDMLHYPGVESFDILCTDSFLGRFAPAERSRLMATWQRLLRPGGRVITVKRVRPDGGDGATSFTAGQARAFLEKVLQAAESLRDSLQVEPAALVREAERYARLNRTWPLRSAAEIRELFEGSGFRMARLSGGDSGVAAPGESSGPGTAGSREYVQIVATRV